MKSFLIILSLASTTAIAAQSPPAKYMTVDGSEFVLAPSAPAVMQPAYKDAQGLTWGDVIKNEQGQVELFFGTDAIRRCADIKSNGGSGRLPTLEEFIRLRETMSTSKNLNSLAEARFGTVEHNHMLFSMNDSYNTSAPALPNLGYGFWSSSHLGSADGSHYAFFGAQGNWGEVSGGFDIGVQPYKYLSARCVVDPL
jgi:hypothetical protein